MNKPRGRPFQSGNTMGRGRPKRARNKEKSPEQGLLQEYAPHLTRKGIALAMEGDRSAMRLCMERIIPSRRGACLTMNLPAIRTAGDVDKAAAKLMQDIWRGAITPAEGGSIMNTLESRTRIIEKAQLEGKKLEEHVVANQPVRDPGRAVLSDDELA
jgi:hypothetical protein